MWCIIRIRDMRRCVGNTGVILRRGDGLGNGSLGRVGFVMVVENI